MQILDPSKLVEADKPLDLGIPQNPNDRYLVGLYLWANRISLTTFILLEFLIGLSIFSLIIWYGLHIFVFPDATYISKAQKMVRKRLI